MSVGVYQFGDWRVEPEQNRIYRGEVERHLEPLSMNALAYLLDHPGETVSTDRLLDVLWRGRYVEPNAVPRVVNQIRHALGDDPKAPRYIETIRTRGYRLVADVQPLNTDGAGHRNEDAMSPSLARKVRGEGHERRRRNSALVTGLVIVVLTLPVSWWLKAGRGDTELVSSVAVMPLMSIDLPADAEWLTHGVASELTTMLASIPDLTVGSQAETFTLAESGVSVSAIARKLGVEAMLVGSLERVGPGPEIVLRMEMIREDGAQLVWRESFRASIKDPWHLKENLAGQVFNYFGISRTEYGRARPESPGAYAAHLKRVAETLTGDLITELSWAETTTALEPGFAMGYINEVFPLFYSAVEDPFGPWKAKIRQALDNAARLGLSESASYKAHEGLYQWVYEHDFDRAEQLLREAFVAGDYYGRIYYARLIGASGIHEPLLEGFERRVVIEPQAPLNWTILGHQRAYSGDYDGAIEAFERARRMDMEHFMSLEKLALAQLANDDVSAAQASVERMKQLPTPTWRLNSLDALLRSRLNQDSIDPLEFAMSLEGERPSWPKALILQTSRDPRARKMLEEGLSEMVDWPGWGKYWLDEIEWAMSPEDRNSAVWQRFREALGYTDAWRLELCRRMATLPAELQLSCNPAQYDTLSL